MGNLSTDAKNLILGNDGSDKEPSDFKTELQKAIKDGIINKAEGTLLITARTNCEKMAEKLVKSEEKVVTDAGKDKDNDSPDLEHELEKEKKEEKEKKRVQKSQEQSLEEQIKQSQNATKAKMKSEKNLDKVPEKGNSRKI